MGIFFKWEIDKIYIYPFGGITKFNTKINTNIKEEFLVLINGFIFQIIYFFIITILFKEGIIRESTYNIYETYHYNLLYFNLIPIYPLDGSKLIKMLNEIFVPLSKITNIVTIISGVFTMILLYKYRNLNTVLICIYLMIFNIKLLKEKKYIFNKFLIERMFHNFKFKKTIIINDEKEMKKNNMHIFKSKNKYYVEKDYINKKFDNLL